MFAIRKHSSRNRVVRRMSFTSSTVRDLFNFPILKLEQNIECKRGERSSSPVRASIESADKYTEELLAQVSSKWSIFNKQTSPHRTEAHDILGGEITSIDTFIEKTVNEVREVVGFIAGIASSEVASQIERMTLNQAITKSEALAETLEIKRLFVRSVSHEVINTIYIHNHACHLPCSFIYTLRFELLCQW
jgi:hypothetical protein